jgi:hypothetical protein
MKGIFYMTITVVGLNIVFNIYFLCNREVYNPTYGTIISLSTFIALTIFLTMTIIRKKKLKKALHTEYDKIFSKN